MGEKRQWDESRSPQWRYLLSKDSHEKRKQQQKEQRMEQAEGALKRGVSKRKKLAQERRNEKRQLNKAGKEILYSASPGGDEKNRYNHKEFVESRHNKKDIKIFEIENEK